MTVVALPPPPSDTSYRIKVNHVFTCDGCGFYWLGRELFKIDGKRKCRNCFMPVQDITFTENAQLWLSYMGVPSIE